MVIEANDLRNSVLVKMKKHTENDDDNRSVDSTTTKLGREKMELSDSIKDPSCIPKKKAFSILFLGFILEILHPIRLTILLINSIIHATLSLCRTRKTHNVLVS